MHGPKLEQIDGGDPTFRVEVEIRFPSTGEEDRILLPGMELLDHAGAMTAARDVWAKQKDRLSPELLRVCVVNERTGFTSDEIGRP
jgi:hypothetical protein